MVLSGIKTLRETGEILTTPGPPRWMQGTRAHLSEIASRRE
jgi:hypothetical protein